MADGQIVRLKELLKNFLMSQEYVDLVLIYSREGNLITKFGKVELETNQAEESSPDHLSLSDIVEKLLVRLRQEYTMGHYGSGSFDTPNNRVCYFEAGPTAMLLCICDFYINLDEFFPIAYLIAEKAAQILEGSFVLENNSLKIPILNFHKGFNLELDRHPSGQAEPIFDHVYHKHHVRREGESISIHKIIVLGSEAVGKTTLINRFLSREQTQDYRPTIGVAISTQTYFIQGFKEIAINFLIYDLAGQKFFKRVRRDYYQGANCAIIVYDTTRKETLDEAINVWYADAKKELGDIPYFLVGNKIDLDAQREITKEEGQEAANQIQCEFTEASALENINVQDTFNIIGIRLYFKKYPLE
ncbi:MAG: GTP-binding protein [Promethearchaeota archaeon]|nr:MAG: GTP-binding protein [Candidatus Lokiarchaeota archaeon]